MVSQIDTPSPTTVILSEGFEALYVVPLKIKFCPLQIVGFIFTFTGLVQLKQLENSEYTRVAGILFS